MARWRTRGLSDARFLAGPVEALCGPYALVTWFLPFVTEAALQRTLLAAAGLPFRELGVPAAALSPFEHPRPALPVRRG